MTSQKLQAIIGESMKAGNFLRTETLRMLSSAFNYERIALQHDLTDEEELSVLRKQAKQRRDSIEAYKKANAPDRAKKEEDELKILQEFLPPEIPDEEIAKLVDEAVVTTGAKSLSEMGKVIGAVKAKAPSVDGSKIAELTKLKLNG